MATTATSMLAFLSTKFILVNHYSVSFSSYLTRPELAGAQVANYIDNLLYILVAKRLDTTPISNNVKVFQPVALLQSIQDKKLM